MKRSPNHQSYIRISGGGEAPVNPLSPENLSLSPPGIDIDQLAAAMGQKKGMLMCTNSHTNCNIFQNIHIFLILEYPVNAERKLMLKEQQQSNLILVNF